ncbi:MAG: nitroreductase family protein [Bacteroidaceae bacterium]|nr:nitroreductase family protein [Bacteroidaceae bacterium]
MKSVKTLDEIAATRRSIRKYDASQSVSRAELETVIKFAQEAPSWKNQQTSRYHVVCSPDLVLKLRDCLGGTNPQKTEGAKALIVTTFRHNIVGFNREGVADNEVGNGWGFYDLGLQNAYLLLKAAEIGLDTLVIGIRNEPSIRVLLNIPEDETIAAVIAVGHRIEDAQRPPRKELDSIVSFY